jgi:hypothetical protein
VELQDIHLHQAKETLEIADANVPLDSAIVGAHVNAIDGIGHPLGWVFLEKRLAAFTIGASENGQGSVGELGEHARSDSFVVLSELALGQGVSDPAVREDDAIRIGKARGRRGRDGIERRLRLRGPGSRGLADDGGRIDVVPESTE